VYEVSRCIQQCSMLPFSQSWMPCCCWRF
jgi:hypothetical protein